MQAWIVWLIVGGVLLILEMVVMTFDLALIGAAALAAGLAGALGLGLGGQFAIFVAVAVAGLGVVRPLARRRLRQPPALRSGVAALIGREAVVLAEVNRHAGLVRIGGEQWSARPYDPTLVIPPGTTVEVLAIEGATALVHPRESL